MKAVLIRIYRPIDHIGWTLFGNSTYGSTPGRALRSFRIPPMARSVRYWNIRLKGLK